MPLAIGQIDVVKSRGMIATRPAIGILVPEKRSGTHLDRQFLIAGLSIVDGEQEGGILVVRTNGGEDGEILRKSVGEHLGRRHAELSFGV